MQILDIMYLILWAGLGAYCLIMARKLSPILYILGGFFAFMFIWYLVNDLTAVDMFAGTYNFVFRGICLVFLVVVIIMYIMIKKSKK
ncbi:MAG: hypothetical protein IJ903_01115 [Ruminococcus sp.]|nr:hypothetical protein [Ruminococcus sp.]